MRRSQVGYPDFSRSFRGGVQDESDAELIHQAAIDAAHTEHERVRKIAEDALLLAELRFDHLRLQETVEQEHERLRLEREHAALAAKAIELQKQHIPIPKPSPRAQTPPPQPIPKVEPRKAPSPVREALRLSESIPITHTDSRQKENIPPKPPLNIPDQPQRPTTTPKPAPQTEAPRTAAPSTRPVTAPPIEIAKAKSTVHFLPGIERYREIHKNLKNLRKFMEEEKKRNPILKTKMGDMRRGIRVAIGQLTGVKGANREPVRSILHLGML